MGVHPSMSPKGVEHEEEERMRQSQALVHPSMSPKGVEHLLAVASSRSSPKCIHQCRRKALSTLAKETAPRSAGLCIHQCRRKALSTDCGADTSTKRCSCIHQCRRKALSTFPPRGVRRSYAVHPSMSPKGVEHSMRQVHLGGLYGASINVAGSGGTRGPRAATASATSFPGRP